MKYFFWNVLFMSEKMYICSLNQPLKHNKNGKI